MIEFFAMLPYYIIVICLFPWIFKFAYSLIFSPLIVTNNLLDEFQKTPTKEPSKEKAPADQVSSYDSSYKIEDPFNFPE